MSEKNINPFDHNRFLGYICGITPQYIKIHFPSAKLLHNFYHEGDVYAGGNVGNFIVIEGDEYGFLARVTELELTQSERNEITEKAIQNSDTDFHPIGKAELLLTFDVFNPLKTNKTASKSPAIGAKVFACSDNQIQKYIEKFGEKPNEISKNVPYAELGKLISNNTICKVSLNALFGRHCAIVGTTGGGKSWTVAKLIEETQKKTTNAVVLIDATGEYKGLVKKEFLIGTDVYFSFKELSNSEFCFLFREHSPNTANALCEAINTLKLVKLRKLTKGIKVGEDCEDINTIINENSAELHGCDFDISKLASQIRNECVKQNSKGKYEEDNFKLGYCSHLISRVNMFLSNSTIKKALGIEKEENCENITTKIENIINKNDPDNLIRIGFENLSYDFSIREIIVDFIASKLLKESRKGVFKEYPCILFIDEAHQFLNKRINADDDTSFSLQNIDLIAKEARKYGLFLCLATQMPRDIPIGTLSQMGTFIVHRLINEQDKKAIENAASAANHNILSFLPILGEGEALLVGVDFPMPLLIKIDAPQHKPDSGTPKLLKKQS